MPTEHKNFRLKNLKYEVDEKINQQILDLQKKFDEKFDRGEQKKLALSEKVDYVYNTTAIEGNTYTYAETETLLSGVTIGGHTIKETNEIVNQKEAWEFTLDKAFLNSVEMTEELIKDIHYRVGKDTVVKPAQYRDGRIKISGTDYIPSKTRLEIDNLIKNFLVDFKDFKEDVFLRALIIHFVIALIQPFYDGNKRTARLLMNFVLLQNSYPLFSVPAKMRKNYVEAMIKGYESLDINNLIKILSELMIKRLKDYNL